MMDAVRKERRVQTIGEVIVVPPALDTSCPTRDLSMNSMGSPRSPTASSPKTRRNRLKPGSPSSRAGGESSMMTTLAASQRLMSRFIRAQPTVNFNDETPIRTRLSKIIDSHWAQGLMASVTVISFVSVVADTDARASGSTMATWLQVMEHVLFSSFVLELMARLVVERAAGFRNVSTCADTLVVASGTMEYALALFGITTNFATLRVLRLVRLLKLSRVVYQFPFFGELRKMISMIGSCFKTLFWSFLVLGVVLTVWSIVAVELLNPVVKELSEKGHWTECTRCRRAFASVFESNITFFQTIVAGDSWGKMAIPIIEAHPWTLIIFTGALLTVVFGVMNVIVAVIVDAFAEARSKDIFTRANDLALEEKREKKVLQDIFNKVDKNGDGQLSLSELNKGAQRVEMFSHWLRVLDIDATDLEEMFGLLDRDGSGDVSAEEFIEFMYRLKNGDAKTATHFLKQKVSQLAGGAASKESEELEKMQKTLLEVSKRIERHQAEMKMQVEAVKFQVKAIPRADSMQSMQSSMQSNQVESNQPLATAGAHTALNLTADMERNSARAPTFGLPSHHSAIPPSLGVNFCSSAGPPPPGAFLQVDDVADLAPPAPPTSFRRLSKSDSAVGSTRAGSALSSVAGTRVSSEDDIDASIAANAKPADVPKATSPAPFLLQDSDMSPPSCRRSTKPSADVDLGPATDNDELGPATDIDLEAQ